MKISIEKLIELYKTARTARVFDERIRRGLAAGELMFSYWPSEGQEGISAGMCAALNPDDQMVITYRGAADAIAKGVPLKEYAAELLGKATGTSKGKGGAMGINAPNMGLMAATGIVGAGAPIANGLALAAQLKNNGKVVVVSFGDGATSTGAVHEAMNMAALWQLPIIFLCHNNLFGEGTPVADYTRTERFTDRAAAYGIPGVKVDGTDTVAVYEAAVEAVARARNHQGPTFIEAVAFRLNGHYFGDPCAYVDKEALARAKANEPIGKLRARLKAEGVADGDIDAIDAAVNEAVDVAVRAAIEAPNPNPNELFSDVYANRSDEGYLSPKGIIVPALPTGDTENLSMADAINQTLDHALASDNRVIMLGEDIADPVGGLFTVTSGLSTKHGKSRVIATPIAEQGIIGAAIGAAIAGMRPIAELMFVDFLGIAMDQLCNHAAKLRYMSGGRATVPLVMRTVEGAFSGAQHSQALEAWLLHTPGLKVVIPTTAADAKGLLNACIQDDDPCVFIESMPLLLARKQRGPVPKANYTIPLGVADIKREGKDITVVAWGTANLAALQAADELKKEGIDAEVIDPRCLVPFDLDTVVNSVNKTKRLVIAHNATLFCGFGAEIAALVQKACFGVLRSPIERVASPYTPVPRSTTLELIHTPSAARIVSVIKEMLP